MIFLPTIISNWKRYAKQTGELVISISQRRNIITVFKGTSRYVLEETESVLNKANQALQTLEKYKKVFDSKLNILNEYEFNDIVTLDNVLTVIQRAEMVKRIVDEIQNSIYQLGADGRLVNMQLQELIEGLQKEEELIVKDYLIVDPKEKITIEDIIEELSKLSYEELRNLSNIAKIIKYEFVAGYEEVAVYPKGYRVLDKIPRMPVSIIENLVKSFKSFQHILAAEIKDLDDVEGIGEVRARTIKQSLQRMQEQFVFENINI